MTAAGSTGAAEDPVEAFHTRVEAAVAGTPYRPRRTEWGLELTVDVNAPQWQELLTRHRVDQVHTYRVALRPQEKAFTMTDVVRTVEYEAGPGGVRLGRTVSTGRSVYATRTWNLDGTQQYSFSSAEGHRLIRDVARELGWREIRPASVKIAIGFGIFGGVIALGTLVALAAVFWL
ncbi:hypothetical protein ABZ915_06160 [Streptomyces sp. NPDC046915]|uniref:hypothetical protein n=1 Tax=Streptomyces sp. NPDC046915 TaxID=3155257 RepID=UPI0033CE10B0